MVSLTVFLAVMGAADIQSHEVKVFDNMGECAAAANNLMMWIGQGTPGMKTLAAADGIVILEHPNGDQMALTCKEKEQA